MNTKPRHKKIFHGLSEIAGQAWYSVSGLRQAGENVDLVEWQKNPFGYPYDILLNIDKRKKYFLPWYALKVFVFFIYAVYKYKIFHFHFARSICNNHDLWLLKLLNKKIVFEYHGSEIRDPKIKYIETQDEFFNNKTISCKTTKINKRICKYAYTIIFHDDELIPHLPANTSKIFVVPLRIDLDKFIPNYPKENAKTVRIVHAPSSRSVKGTDSILKAVEQLKLKYNIDLILVENTPQEEAKKIYMTADIIVDQLVIGTYGVFAIEGMALGKPVVTYITEEMKKKFPEELPIISADRSSIYEVLEKLVLDSTLRREIGISSRNYVETYHDYRINAKMLSLIYYDKLQPVQGKDAFKVVKELYNKEKTV